jgi:hypothetical protein
LLLFIILVLVLSIPAVQTSLGNYVTNRLNEDFNTNISIGRIGLQFNGDVELKEILIQDHHQDSLIAVRELNTSIISFKVKIYLLDIYITKVQLIINDVFKTNNGGI